METAEECLARDDRGAGGAVVLGEGNTACEAACWLRERGREATILAPGRDLARDVEAQTRQGALAELSRLGVRVVREARVREIRAGRVYFSDGGGEALTLPAALVVVAGPPAPDDAPVRTLEAGGRRTR